MASKFLDSPGITHLWEKIKALISDYAIGYSKQYLTFDVLTGGTITFNAHGSSSSKTIYCRLSTSSTWSSVTSQRNLSVSLGTFSAGDKVYVKGTNTTYSTSSSEYNNFGGTAQVNVSGNIMSLIHGDDFIGENTLSTEYVFAYLFRVYENLISAENLVLPTSTTNSCYRSMFYGCTGLTTSPVLPATTLSEYCYYTMFQGCTSLINVQDILCTTLAAHCCENMLRSCTALKKAPKLLATTLVDNCYTSMLRDSSNLEYIEALFTTTPSSLYTSNWVSGVAATGTFVKSDSATWTTTGVHGIPTGWNVYTESEWEYARQYQINELSGELDDKVDKVTSTDNAIVRFDGTSGNIQNSGVTINDSNHLTAAKLITSGGTSSQFVKGDGSLDSTSYAPLASPALTGTPSAPTAASGTNTTQIATTAFVKSAVDDLSDTLTDGTAASESGATIDIGEYDLMKINEVKGKSFVWNQWIQNPNVTSTNTDTATSLRLYVQWFNGSTYVSSYNTSGDIGKHSYVLTASSTATNAKIVHNGSTRNLTFYSNLPVVGGYKYYYSYEIINNDISTVGGVEIHNNKFIDLTKMFGVGNEPTTVEEVEAILGNEYYEYNTGEVVGNNVEKLDVYDTSDTKKGSLALNLTELIGKANGEGTSVTIYPNGLHGVGTVYDSLIVDEDGYARRAIKRMGSVDLGSLNWARVGSYNFFTGITSAAIKRPSSNFEAIKGACSMYQVTSSSTAESTNMCIGVTRYGEVKIKNDTYDYGTDAAAFKTAMSGVMLYYELATPIEYVLDTPVQCVAKVYPNGTVKQVPVMPDSTPIVMDVTYLHDTGGVIGGLMGNYATKEYVGDVVGNIETLLASI